MPFDKKSYTNRNSEYPGRRRLVPTGKENVYDAQRDEGLVYDEGTPYSADTMNSLETRIETAVAASDNAAAAAHSRADAAYSLANTANSNSNGKAPTNHAVNSSTYGLGNTNVYGHVKVSDAYSYNPGNASQGVAASGAAVYAAYDRANSAYNLASSTNSKVVNTSTDQRINGHKTFVDNITVGYQLAQSGGGEISGLSESGLIFRTYRRNGVKESMGIIMTGPQIYPYTNSTNSAGVQNPVGLCGTSTARWHQMYCFSVNQSSDARLKEDIEPIESSLATRLVKNLTGRRYRMKVDENDTKHFGFIAQEVIKVFEQQGVDISNNQYGIVSKGDDEEGLYGMSYTDFIPILSEALKESLHTQDRLDAELAALREEVNELKSALQAR